MQPDTIRSRTLSRRQLLGGAGLAVAAASLPHGPVLRSPLDLTALGLPRTSLRIGVVHTSSPRWDAFDGGVVGGIQQVIAGLPWLQAEVDARPAPGGVAGVRDQVRDLAPSSDLLVLAVSRPMGSGLEDVLAQVAAPTLIAATGAATAPPPRIGGVAVHGLHLAEAAAATGALAVQRHGPRVAVVGTRSEMLHSTWGHAERAVSRAGGQVVTAQTVEPAEGVLAAGHALQAVRAASVDVVILDTSADQDGGLLGLLAEGALGTTPIFAGPLAADPSLRAVGGTPEVAATVCSPLAPAGSADGVAMAAPDLGTLLGVESGLLLADAVARSQMTGRGLVATLPQAVAQTPRGVVRMGPDAVSAAPVWITSPGGAARSVTPRPERWVPGGSALMDELLCL